MMPMKGEGTALMILRVGFIIMTAESQTRFCQSDQCQTDPRLIMIGGYPSSSRRLVEIFPPSSSLSIPSLPQGRYYHSLTLLPGPPSRLVVCGGYGTGTRSSCISYSARNGAWQNYYTLKQDRYGHSAARIGENSMMILGGGGSSKTTAEIVPGGGQFALEHDSKYACAIAVEDSKEVVLTGGGWPTIHGHVSRYSSTGFLGSLPDLRHKRRDHACGSFVTGQGDTVLLVTGGNDGGRRLSSTETLRLSSPSAWTLKAALPLEVSGLSAATLPDGLYVAGGYDGDSYRDEVWKYQAENDTWQMVGRMDNGKRNFAMVAANIAVL